MPKKLNKKFQDFQKDFKDLWELMSANKNKIKILKLKSKTYLKRNSVSLKL